MGAKRFHALYAAVSTAVNLDGSPDVERCLDHWTQVINAGAYGICPFGTTGEGVSFSASTKMSVLERAVEVIHPVNMMPVVGACAIEEAVDLVAHAHGLGCSGCLLLPPYYFKNPSNHGIYEFYARVINEVNNDDLRLFVYNIPQLTGVIIQHDVVRKLVNNYGNIIAGIKDSWGKLSHTLAYIQAFPDRAVFTGTDKHIVETMLAGGAGTITGMANINSSALRKIVDTYLAPETKDFCYTAGDIHLIVETFGGIAAMKAIIAHYLGDECWKQMIPPLVNLSEQECKNLITELNATGFAWTNS